jgi:hypothetical protein
MNLRRLVLCCGLAAMLAGCGNHRLVLRVDVLSFLSPAQAGQTFGPLPPSPFPVTSVLVNDLDVNLLEGLSGAAVVQSVTITTRATFTDLTGSGADTLRVYLSDENTDPLTTPAALVLPVTLSPGVSDTVTATLGDDPRVADLFTKKRMRMSITTTLRPPASGPALTGSRRLLALDAVAIARRKDF